MEDDLPEFEEVKQRQRELRFNIHGKHLPLDKFNSPIPNKPRNDYSIELDINPLKNKAFITPQMFHASNQEPMDEGFQGNELSHDFIHSLIQNIGRTNQFQDG